LRHLKSLSEVSTVGGQDQPMISSIHGHISCLASPLEITSRSVNVRASDDRFLSSGPNSTILSEYPLY
jgi:hypothetical protein